MLSLAGVTYFMDNLAYFSKRILAGLRVCFGCPTKIGVYRLKAFSLIEISIVLGIVGVLLTGAIKGYGLLENARLKSIVMQISNYRLAVQTFRDRHSAWPGNYDMASTYIDQKLSNGRGDGIIHGKGFSPGNQNEALAFWDHLIASQLVSDVQRRQGTGLADYGNGLPRTKIGGGITIEHNPHPDLQGHWLVIGTKTSQDGRGALLTPNQAFAILRQFSNGDPLDGDEQVRDASGLHGENRCLKNGALNMQSKAVSCVLYAKLQD